MIYIAGLLQVKTDGSLQPDSRARFCLALGEELFSIQCLFKTRSSFLLNILMYKRAHAVWIMDLQSVGFIGLIEALALEVFWGYSTRALQHGTRVLFRKTWMACCM